MENARVECNASSTAKEMTSSPAKKTKSSSEFPSSLGCNVTDRNDYQTSLIDLPWVDIIFPLIMPCLSLQDQFRLRAVNQEFRELVSEYFRISVNINIARIAGKLNVLIFEVLTKNNFHLQSLNLRNAKDWLSDSVLIPVLKQSSRLSLLDLTNCNSLTNSSMQMLAVHCNKLEVLVLRDCHWLSAEGMMVIAMNCTELKRVDLTGCWNLNDEAISMLVLHCKKLRYLSLAKIYGVTDAAMCLVARESPCLHHLNVQGCWRISDDSVRLLGEFCHSLAALQIRECRDVTENTLARLREKKVKIDVRPPVQYRRVDMLHHGLRHRLNIQV